MEPGFDKTWNISKQVTHNLAFEGAGVQEHCSLSIGILDPSDQDSSWCPHTRRTSVGGGKHIPENERNISSGDLT